MPAKQALTVHIEFRDGNIDRLLADLAKLRDKDLGQMIRDRSQMFARYMAENTAPFSGARGGDMDGASKTAQNLGTAAVRRDIRRVYSPWREAYAQIKAQSTALAKKFWAAMKAGQFAEARGVLNLAGLPQTHALMAFDSGALHRASRDGRGRIHRNQQPRIVDDDKALKAYTRAVEKRVGYTKSGWLNAASQISNVGRAQSLGWIKRHSAPGSGEDGTRNTAFPTIRLTNLVPWVSQAMTPGLERIARAAFAVSLRKEVDAALAYIARRDATRTSAVRGDSRRIAA